MTDYYICKRCIQDSNIPGIMFDNNGICNYCHLHDKLSELFPNDERGTRKLEKIINDIKKKSKNKEFDCVIGISGGRDSIYLLYNAVKIWKLRVLAVNVDDGFCNPTAKENMKKAVEKLNVKFISIKYPLELTCDIKKSFLKASVPDLNMGMDIAITTALYSTAYKYGIKNIFIGHSFRTEGIKPLDWYYFDGEYLKSVHKQFGCLSLGRWCPSEPGYNFDLTKLFFYMIICGIRIVTPLFYINYIRKEAEKIMINELNWVYPGAHYFDDLYHSVVAYVHRVKFNINMNINSDAALVRDGQLDRQIALQRAKEPYHIENQQILEKCLKKMNITNQEFENILKLPPKTFRDYKTSYNFIKLFKYPIKILSEYNIVPKLVYEKYFGIDSK